MFKKLEDMYEYSALPLRIGLAALFLFTGIKKAIDLTGTAGYLEGLGFPAPAVMAVILMTAEIIGGAFLLFGFLTRLSAILLAIVLIVATISAHIIPYDPSQLMLIMRNIVYFGATISIMFSGPGKWSLDEKFFWE